MSGLPVDAESEGAHSGRLLALVALADLELHALPLIEAAEAARVDLGVVHEDVVAAAVLGDEAEALLRVKPFHSSLCHAMCSSYVMGPHRVGDRPTLVALARILLK